MTAKEAIMILESIQPSCGEKYSFSESEIYEAIDMAISALEFVQKILDNGYSGKEAEFRIGGRLFGIKEKAQ